MDNQFNPQQGQNQWQNQGQWGQQPQQNQWQPQQPQQNQWQQEQPQQPYQDQQQQYQQQQQQYQQQQYQQQQNWQNPQPNYQDQQGQWQPNPNYPDPNLGAIGFVEAIKICFNKYADFNGRAPRAEFWWWYLFTVIISLATFWIPIVGQIISLALLVPGLAVCWRRLHDIGKGGGWYFFGFIPLVGAIMLIIWLAKEGEPHPNRFGPNPYGINDGCAPWQ